MKMTYIAIAVASLMMGGGGSPRRELWHLWH